MRVRRIFIAIVFILLLICGNLVHAYGGITVIPGSGTNEDALVLVNKIVASFNDIVRKEMKVTLSRNVQLYLCPTEENYVEILRKKFKFSKKEAIVHAKTSLGMSRDDLAVIAVNFNPEFGSNVKYRALSVTTHELAHQLQADLSGNYAGRNLRWMREGTADLTAAIVASKCGYESFREWKLSQMNYFRGFEKYASPEAIGHLSLDEWDKLGEDKMHPYQVSDLMVLFLMDTTKKNFYEAMAEYFEQASSLKEDALSFEESFGVPLKQFNDESAKCLEQLKKEESRLEVVTTGQASADQDLRAAFDLSQRIQKEKFEINLRSHQRIIVASDKKNYIATLCNEFGTIQSKAEELAEKGTWRFSTGTTIIEISSYPDRQKRFYRVGNVMLKKLLKEQVSSRLESGTFWFRNGSAELFAGMLVEQAGLVPAGSYRKSWIAAIDNKKPHPIIEELETSPKWDDAIKKYGEESVNGYGALAISYLIESKGMEQVIQWLKSIKELRDSKAAFEKNFAITPKEFENLLERYLQSLQTAGEKNNR